ncbi:NAD(P)H-binding protein [Planotetraspora thailandica]|uniref:NAD(P)H-binding protein n=1 Tax=Planotetraspora thailandica TaxID=487172 RepID=UPI001EF3B4A2|nr:NAD(P)H-binding protein [Planotetraspora thailandica]
MNDTLIVVSAASGALGRLVIGDLVSRVPAGQIVAAVRDPGRTADLAGRGVQVRRGDYDDAGSLREAFKGAARLLLISSPELDPGRRIAQHTAAIEAAGEAGVSSVVYTSVLGADVGDTGVAEAHHATERAIFASGLPYTVVRNPFYSEAFINAGLREAVASGELTSGTGGRGLNTALRADLAEAAAVVLTQDGHLGHAYDLTGPLWTYPQLVDVLSEVAGRPVSYRGDAAVPGALGWLHGQARAGMLETQTDDLALLLGRSPTTLRQAVAAALSAQIR